MKNLAAIFVMAAFVTGLTAPVQAAAPLKLVTEYTMAAAVKGRFDHLTAASE